MHCPIKVKNVIFWDISIETGFGTLLGGFKTGYDTFQDSAKNGRF